MGEFIFRTEELNDSQFESFFVSSPQDQSIIDKLKAPSPVLLVGSRGVGKSFLFKFCANSMFGELNEKRILPISVTFRKSSLLQTDIPEQFRHWMLCRICSELIRSIKRTGRYIPTSHTIQSLIGSETEGKNRLDSLVAEFEESWKTPGNEIQTDVIPSLDDFINIIEDLCHELDYERMVVFIDEAAHIFNPQQQREFFTLFRDLRSPYIKCNAAVYPGVTVYGDTFEPMHDALIITLNRNINDEHYVENMKAMVLRQTSDTVLSTKLSRNAGYFTLLAYAASGNPRHLLNSVAMADKMDSNAVNQVFREYYREKLWSEHSNLSRRYPGYQSFIDWGRDYVETHVIPELKRKNDHYFENKTNKGTTMYFWVHKNAPEEVKTALRLLEYSGLIYEDGTGIRATRSEVGTRYMVNIGCLLAYEASASTNGLSIIQNADIRRMSEYGANHQLYSSIKSSIIGNETEALKAQFERSIDELELTEWQKAKMHEISIHTIGDLLSASEEKLQGVKYIAEARARNIRNACVAAVCEYLLG